MLVLHPAELKWLKMSPYLALAAAVKIKQQR
jgi:hypothetical protein